VDRAALLERNLFFALVHHILSQPHETCAMHGDLCGVPGEFGR
jgi:hypothetical protein